MIRDKYKIYGELNDPHTVLAEKFLEPGQFVVGSGNRGVKTYVPKKKNAMLVIKDGVMTEFELEGKNKFVGANMYGELELFDMKPREPIRYRTKIDNSSKVKKAVFIRSGETIDFMQHDYGIDVAGMSLNSPLHFRTNEFSYRRERATISVNGDAVTVTLGDWHMTFEPSKTIEKDDGSIYVVDKNDESIVHYIIDSPNIGGICRFEFEDGIKIQSSKNSKLYISFLVDVRNFHIDPYITSGIGQNDIFSIGEIELTNDNGDNIILVQDNLNIPVTSQNVRSIVNKGCFYNVVELDIDEVDKDISLNKLNIIFRKVEQSISIGSVDLDVYLCVTVCQVIGDENGSIRK